MALCLDDISTTMAVMSDEATKIADTTRGVAAKHRATQSYVAGLLGISRGAVNARMNGQVPFTATEILTLSDAFNEPVSAFFPQGVRAIEQVA